MTHPDAYEDGHCHICGGMTNGMAGNPSLWPLRFPANNNTGACVFWHVGCVMAKMSKVEDLEDEIRELNKRIEYLEDEEQSRKERE